MFRYLLLVFLFLTLGCSSKQPNIDFDPKFSTASLRTYSLVHTASKDGDTLNHERIRKAIISEMQIKGYKQANEDSADFHITFESLIKEDVPSNMSFGFGFGTFSKNVGTSIGTSHNLSGDKGSLLIHMIDPSTNKTFWQASFTKDVHKFTSPIERADYFKKIVADMLKEFPSTID